MNRTTYHPCSTNRGKNASDTVSTTYQTHTNGPSRCHSAKPRPKLSRFSPRAPRRWMLAVRISSAVGPSMSGSSTHLDHIASGSSDVCTKRCLFRLGTHCHSAVPVRSRNLPTLVLPGVPVRSKKRPPLLLPGVAPRPRAQPSTPRRGMPGG